MSGTQKKKLCWNCEGRVTLAQENCPYCGVYLSPTTEGDGKDANLIPPYKMAKDEEVPASPYKGKAVETASAERVATVEDVVLPKDDVRNLIVTMAMLIMGSGLFLFSIVLMFFSEDGSFELRWQSENWYIYLLLSLPMLFMGWRYLQQIKDDG
jgi:sporulation protein YlmC with PRC-barrel domain